MRDKQLHSKKMRSPLAGFDRALLCFDADGDGKISASELCSCMRIAGGEMSREEAEAFVRSVDSDGDGLLDVEEFMTLVEGGGEEEEEREMRQAFVMYEMEGEGCITPRSLKRMLSRLGMPWDIEACEVMIRRFDENGDGVLSFEEFRKMMAV